MTMHSKARPALVAALSATLAAALAACSSPESDEPASEETAIARQAEGPRSGAGGATGAPLLLEALEPGDRAGGQLQGELGCAFYASRGDDPLFMGAGSVSNGASAQGLLKIDGEPVLLTMEGLGGYDRMADGARFTAETLSADIEVTGSEPLAEDPPVAGESPMLEARLTVAREGRTIAIDGFYECGP
jgi:hypothetical protein